MEMSLSAYKENYYRIYTGALKIYVGFIKEKYI